MPPVPDSTAPPLSLSNASVRWDTHWGLKNISLQLEKGQLCLLLGANGAGKTTLLHAFCGLQPLSSGTVQWHGQLFTKTESVGVKARQDIGWLAHQHRFYLELTARENLTLLAGLYRLKQPTCQVELALSQVQLQQTTEQVSCFSQGMIQRLGLARLSLHQPSIWLLDEPFNHLDAPASKYLLQMLSTHLQAGGTVLMTSHQPEVVFKLAHRVVLLDKGEIRYHAPVCHASGFDKLQQELASAIL